jgi:hypothetical protein
MAKADREAEQRRLAALRQAGEWRERCRGWEEERARNGYGEGELVRLVKAERGAATKTARYLDV